MKDKLIAKCRDWFQNGKRHPILFVLDAARIGMCVVFLVALSHAAGEFSYAFDQGYDEDELYYKIQYGDYSQLTEFVWHNRAQGIGEGALGDYYAVADYYHASLLYHLCKDAGNEPLAEHWSSKMQDAAQKLGSFAAEKEKIDSLLAGQKSP